MATLKTLSIPPVSVPASAANLLNCAVTSLAGPVGFTMTQPFLIVTHMQLNNKTGSPVTVTLYKGASGASAAGSEFGFAAVAVPANSSVDWFGEQRFESTDFLTGVAGAASSVTLNVDAQIGVA